MILSSSNVTLFLTTFALLAMMPCHSYPVEHVRTRNEQRQRPFVQVKLPCRLIQILMPANGLPAFARPTIAGHFPYINAVC